MNSNILQYCVSAKIDEQVFGGKDSHFFSLRFFANASDYFLNMNNHWITGVDALTDFLSFTSCTSLQKNSARFSVC